MSNHAQFLQKALTAAESRRGFCAPNPAVGAVVVKNGEILSIGTHLQAGAAHAERDALAKITPDQANGATIYVTLEPCCHHGRTPPCTDIIIERGLSQVIYGYQDPNPVVGGKGAQILREAGIECLHQPVPEIDQFYQSYQHWQDTKLPFVTAKIAVSLDGRIAGPGGIPVAITGKALKNATFEWRQRTDAILTTAQTILNDNPRLDVRGQQNLTKPLYILDRRGRLTGQEQVFQTGAEITILVAEGVATTYPHGVTVKSLPAPQQFDLSQVLTLIGQDGVIDLWVEAGGSCFSALIQAKLVQQALVYVAPITLGQGAAEGFVTQSNLFADVQQIKWYNYESEQICELRW